MNEDLIRAVREWAAARKAATTSGEGWDILANAESALADVAAKVEQTEATAPGRSEK